MPKEPVLEMYLYKNDTDVVPAAVVTGSIPSLKAIAGAWGYQWEGDSPQMFFPALNFHVSVDGLSIYTSRGETWSSLWELARKLDDPKHDMGK